MALLIETPLSPHRPAGPRRHHPGPGRATPTIHLVPDEGILLFPGVPAGIEPPAQLGPLMSPARGTGPSRR